MADVGIVMPVYKQKAEYLRDSLESILNQNYTDYRLVIVIDGDPSMLEIIRHKIEADSRITVIMNEHNMGVAVALNKGFEVLFADASIRYLTWVSSDNVYYPSYIEVLRHALYFGASKAGLVYSSFQSIDGQGNPIYDAYKLALQRRYQAQPEEKLLESSIIGVSFMYKAEVAKQIDGYRLAPVEDYDYWLRLTEKCEIRYIPVELMDYRVNSEWSVSATLHTKEKHRNWRYTYHLARLQARQRRGISPYATVIYCLDEWNEAAEERLEACYEQTFSNYEIILIDQSSHGEIADQVVQIPHPTLIVKYLPDYDRNLAIWAVVQRLSTPFVYVLGPGKFHTPEDIQLQLNALQTADSSIFSNYYTEDKLLGYRMYPEDKPEYWNELFRIDKLKQLLKVRQYVQGDLG